MCRWHGEIAALLLVVNLRCQWITGQARMMERTRRRFSRTFYYASLGPVILVFNVSDEYIVDCGDRDQAATAPAGRVRRAGELMQLT